MSRAAKRDDEATSAFHWPPRFPGDRPAPFFDKDSFIALDGHQYLEGRDRSRRRAEIYTRDKGRCQKCGALTPWQVGEMHHKKGGNVGRCDDAANLEWICARDHRIQHVQVRSA